MKFQFKTEDGLTTVTLSGNVMGGPDYEPFHKGIKELVEAGSRKFLLDFGGVKWINSTGVGIMVSAYTSVKAAEGRLVICRPNDRVRGTYFISKLGDVFEMYETVEEGREALASA